MPSETRTVECVRCAARGQCEPWGEIGMLPYGWHFDSDSNDVLCPDCWLAGFRTKVETAKGWLDSQAPSQS